MASWPSRLADVVSSRRRKGAASGRSGRALILYAGVLRACGMSCNSVAVGRLPTDAHFEQRDRLVRSWMCVVETVRSVARSTSRFVRQRLHNL
jgi:hypothetical protein